MVDSSPLFNELFIHEILYNIEALHKHLHNKQQMGCQPTMMFIFDKCQNRETSIIFHTTNHLHHSQLSWFDILGDANNQNVGCCHKSPHIGERINVEWVGHACHYIKLRCQFEQSMLTFKVPIIKELEDLNFLSNQGGSLATTKCNIRTSMCVRNDTSTYGWN